MRSSTGVIALLFAAAVVGLLVYSFLPPIVSPLSEYIGEQKAGKAIIPPHLNEQEIREKAAKADGAIRR